MPRAGFVADGPVNDYLVDLAARTTHLTLMTDHPGEVSDPLTVELVGVGFARVAVAWALQPRLMVSATLLVFTGIPPASVVTWIAGFDAAMNGEMTCAAPIGPLNYPDGGTLTIPIGDFLVGFDV